MLKTFPQINRGENYVLIIEDSPIDFEIISRTFKRIQFFPQILHRDNGTGAIEFLMGLADRHQISSMPSLILLDLNLPGIDGREVLKVIKNNKNLQHIPVIVLSTSNNQNDITFCHREGAEKYLQKPTSMDDYAGVARTIREFWECLA